MALPKKMKIPIITVGYSESMSLRMTCVPREDELTAASMNRPSTTSNMVAEELCTRRARLARNIPKQDQLTKCSVKSGLAEGFKITYAQASETKSRIKISLSRTEIKGSLAGARKTAINMRKLAFQCL